MAKARGLRKERAVIQNEAPAAEPTPDSWSKFLLLSGITFASLVIAFVLYSPALDGPFLFDDIGLPFYVRTFAHDSVKAWIGGVRPVLMLSYWLNFQMSVREPWTYHALNILFHALNSVLVYLLFSRVLRLLAVDRRRVMWCSGIAAFLFLAHPLQTEAVAYIAGRSELVCGFFVLAALFVYANPKITVVTWRTSAAVLALYCLAILSKEQAAVLPAVFLMIDMVFRRRSFRQAMRFGSNLYRPIVVIGVLAVIGLGMLLTRASTAGFNLSGIQWYEYLFTQFRVWWLYSGLALLPLRQSADYDLPMSSSLASHGAGLALAGLLIVAFVVWRFRLRYPLLVGGMLLFAIMLAPTSSLIPIQDLAAERRMYLPLVGLLLVLAQALSRLNLGMLLTTGLAAYVLICSALTFERTKVWGSELAFWQNTTQQSPTKARGYTHLTYALIRAGRCEEAVNTAMKAPEKVHDTPDFQGMIGHAQTCNHRLDKAVEAFERAVLVGPGVGRLLALAASYRQAGRALEAEAAEQQAQRMPPKTTYDFSMLDSFNRNLDQTRARYSDGAIPLKAEP